MQVVYSGPDGTFCHGPASLTMRTSLLRKLPEDRLQSPLPCGNKWLFVTLVPKFTPSSGQEQAQSGRADKPAGIPLLQNSTILVFHYSLL
jgi:hypothetical protein